MDVCNCERLLRLEQIFLPSKNPALGWVLYKDVADGAISERGACDDF